MVSGVLELSLVGAWVCCCVKVVAVFVAIVMVRVCTPRFGLGALGRLAWGSVLVYILFFFLIYALALV